MKKLLIVISALLCVFLTGIFNPVDVMAADGQISFDEQSYEAADGDTVNVLMSLDCENNIGAYDIEIVYDRYRLRYEGGGTSENICVIRFLGIADVYLI